MPTFDPLPPHSCMICVLAVSAQWSRSNWIRGRPEHAWPVIIGANRDEMIGRPSQPPGRHWPDRAEIVGGLDLLAGGSWLGVNDWGVAAAILNRQGSLGPAAGLRSRGELVL